MSTETMTAAELAGDHRLRQGGLDLGTALAAARAGRLWAVDTQSRGADALIDADSAEEAIGVVAEHEESDEAIRDAMSARWTAVRVVLRQAGE